MMITPEQSMWLAGKALRSMEPVQIYAQNGTKRAGNMLSNSNRSVTILEEGG